MYSLVLFKCVLSSFFLSSLGFLFMETLPPPCLMPLGVGDKSQSEPLADTRGRRARSAPPRSDRTLVVVSFVCVWHRNTTNRLTQQQLHAVLMRPSLRPTNQSRTASQNPLWIVSFHFQLQKKQSETSACLYLYLRSWWHHHRPISALPASPCELRFPPLCPNLTPMTEDLTDTDPLPKDNLLAHLCTPALRPHRLCQNLCLTFVFDFYSPCGLFVLRCCYMKVTPGGKSSVSPLTLSVWWVWMCETGNR